jgi:hypothetical protein
MDITHEIEALKKVVDSLTPLDEAARIRVMEYASKMLSLPDGIQSHSSQSGSGFKPDEGRKIQKSGKPAGPQEYLRKFEYKVMTKRIAVIAVYLEREKGEKRFSFKAITDAFKDAKEPKPPAHSQYNRAVAMNYLAKDGALYYATSQAEALVDAYKSTQAHKPAEESE